MKTTNRSDEQPQLNDVLVALGHPRRSLATIRLDVLSDLTLVELRQFQDTWIALPPKRQRAVAAELVLLSEDRIDVSLFQIFRWLLEDPDPRIRIQAIEGLWEEEDVRLVAPLLDLLQYDPVVEVQAAAALSLGRFVLQGELGQLDQQSSALIEEALHAVITDEKRDLLVQRRALESLAYSGQEYVPQLIAAAYRHDDDSMRISAVHAMGRNADPSWRDYVLAELAATDAAMRFEAARASGELEVADAIPQLIALLDEDDIEVRDAAVWALGRIGGPEARRALRACCASDDQNLAEAAEDALAELDFLGGDVDIPAFLFNGETVDSQPSSLDH